MAQRQTRFGPYELVRRLGVGGMAETFVAVRRGPGGFEQRVCLKRTLPAFESDKEFVRLFVDEARVSALLRHANIAQVLDFGEVEGSHYLVLELVEGLDLRELCARLAERHETLTSGLVAYLAVELATALAFAHKARHGDGVTAVVHRDISPSNVLVSLEGEVKLTDFGIAKAIRGDHVTKSGVIKGKVPYMAPEYALSAKFDQRSDLFALGVTLYETLAGRRPFDGVTDLDTLHRICNGTHTPLGELVPGAPRVLVDAIERLIRAEPAERFASARDLLDTLVDVTPPPTARRILGELVEGVVARAHSADTAGAAKSGEPVAFEETLHATPKGTVMLPDSSVGAPASREIVSAGPGERTRTRAVDGLVVPEGSTRTVFDPPSATLPETHASDPSLAVEASRTQSPAASATRSDIASATTRSLEDAPRARVPSTFDPPVENPVVARQRRNTMRTLAGLAVVLFAAVAIGGWIAGRPDPDARGAAGAPGAPTSPQTVPAGVARSPSPPPAPAPAVPLPATPTPAPPIAPAAEPIPDGVEPPTPSHDERPATLEIAVVPFGNVWLDGHRLGPAPQTRTIRPGRHVVASGDATPSRSRPVFLAPGERRAITLR